jgi:hypothetical protein
VVPLGRRWRGSAHGCFDGPFGPPTGLSRVPGPGGARRPVAGGHARLADEPALGSGRGGGRRRGNADLAAEGEDNPRCHGCGSDPRFRSPPLVPVPYHRGLRSGCPGGGPQPLVVDTGAGGSHPSLGLPGWVVVGPRSLRTPRPHLFVPLVAEPAGHLLGPPRRRPIPGPSALCSPAPARAVAPAVGRPALAPRVGGVRERPPLLGIRLRAAPPFLAASPVGLGERPRPPIHAGRGRRSRVGTRAAPVAGRAVRLGERPGVGGR